MLPIVTLSARLREAVKAEEGFEIVGMPRASNEILGLLRDAADRIDRLEKLAAAWKALAKVLHADEIHYRVDLGWQKHRVAASRSASTEVALRHEIAHRDARIAALEKERDELRDAFARLPDPPLYAEPVSDDERWARCLGTQIRDARGLIKRARVAEEEAEELMAKLREVAHCPNVVVDGVHCEKCAGLSVARTKEIERLRDENTKVVSLLGSLLDPRYPAKGGLCSTMVVVAGSKWHEEAWTVLKRHRTASGDS
jgi:hypothetical protein